MLLEPATGVVVPKERKADPEAYRFGSQLKDEAVAVLGRNPEATNSEVQDVGNRWWFRTGCQGNLLAVDEVAGIRALMGILETVRRPHQTRFFD